MMHHKDIKLKLTEAIFAEIPAVHKNILYKNKSIDRLFSEWWATGRQSGFRLTEGGVQAFELAEIEYYDHTFGQEKNKTFNSFILEVNKKIQCPYYIGVNNYKEHRYYIRLFDSKISMMLNLYGNLREYLNSIKVKK